MPGMCLRRAWFAAAGVKHRMRQAGATTEAHTEAHTEIPACGEVRAAVQMCAIEGPGMIQPLPLAMTMGGGA